MGLKGKSRGQRRPKLREARGDRETKNPQPLEGLGGGKHLAITLHIGSHSRVLKTEAIGSGCYVEKDCKEPGEKRRSIRRQIAKTLARDTTMGWTSLVRSGGGKK